MLFYDERHKFDYKVKDFKNYPCFREFYEANYACSDDLFEFMMEFYHIIQKIKNRMHKEIQIKF